MKECNNDFCFGNVLAGIVNNGNKSFEDVFNLLYGTKENDSSSEPKHDAESDFQ